jgi:acyl-CoA reductase-like NAD-dependent aldehyde dehydrogenase
MAGTAERAAGDVIESRDPATGEVLGTVPVTTAAGVEAVAE